MDPTTPVQEVPSVTGAEALFLAVKDSFLESISAEESAQFSSCNSPEDLVQSIANISSERDKSWLKRVTRHVESFSQQLQPYFDILGIFVSSHPEWAAIAWGAFRLVLKLASNYSSFFEKLVDLLAEIGRSLPQFADLLQLLVNDTSKEHRVSQRLQLSIQSFYVDLFHLFQAIAGVFTRKNGKIRKSRFLQVAKICWQPFDVQFGSILARLEVHKNVVREEIEIFNTANLIKVCQRDLEQLNLTEQNRAKLISIQSEQKILQKKIESAIEKLKIANNAENQKLRETKDEHLAQVLAMRELLSETDFQTNCDRILAFIDPPEFMDDLEQAQALRDQGTGIWLFQHPSLLKWLTASDEKIFWITGNPGCGKTVLAGAAVSELPARVGPKDIALAYFFFHQAVTTKKTTTNAYRSLLAQLFQTPSTNETLLNALTYAMRRSPQRVASLNNLRDLLLIAAKCIPSIHIIVDGVDECESPDDFVEDLIRLFGDASAKLLFFSRPSVRSIQRTVEEQCRITIDPSLNRADIHLYCTGRINSLIKTGLLPSDIPPVSQMADWIANGADGMFLWARLTFIYLESEALAPPGRAPTVRLHAIRKFRYPDSLDNMYSRIIGLIWSSQSYEKELARQVFHWILCAKTQLLAHELHEILECSYDHPEESNAILPQAQSHVVTENFSAFSSMIILACSSLVEIRHSPRNLGSHYRFIHLSAVEFFFNRIQHAHHCGPDAMAFFSICKPEVEIRLTVDCLKYLKFRVPARPLSGNMLQPARRFSIQQALPFLEYAAIHWGSHLQSCFECQHETYVGHVQRLLSSLSGFLSARLVLMTWVESLYLFGTSALIRERVDSLRQWLTWTTEHNLEALAGIHTTARLNDLALFLDDLVTMDDLWGASLRVAPEQIWQDITAFTPSRFFVQTSATTTQQLSCDNLRHGSLSKVCLCKVSEDMPDGTAMAVLGIWPSRGFHEVWNRASMVGDVSLLHQECSGWVARYQIWDVRADNPQLNEEYLIPLDSNEVWLQVRHFLMRSHSRERQERSKSANQLVLHFPVAIRRSDLRTFAILRTTYTVIGGHQSAQGPGEISLYKSYILHLDFNETLKSIWLQESGPNATSNSSAKYTYGVEFSDCGNYILYQDITGMLLVPKLNKLATTLAVFQVQGSGSGLGEQPANCVSLLGHLERSTINDYFAGWSFHPTLPVLIVQTCAVTEKYPRLMLWNFDCDDFETSLEDFGILKGIAEQINFSDCGTHVIIKYADDIRPQIRSLEGSRLYKAAMKKLRPVANATSQQPARTPGQIGTIAARSLGIQSSGKIQTIQNREGETAFQRVVLSRNGASSVDLVQVDDDIEETQPIVSLPSTTANSHIKASVHAPISRKEKITVILHEAAQPWYSLSADSGSGGPVIVKKDQRAIRPTRKRKVLEGSMTDDQSLKNPRLNK